MVGDHHLLMIPELRFPHRDLPKYAATRRRGFAKAIEALSRRDGEMLVVPTSVWHEQTLRFFKRPAPEGTGGWRGKASRLCRALWRWLRAGCPLSSSQVRRARRAACLACDRWAPEGNLGLGECRHPECGCSGAKRALATEHCPAGKWPV